MPRSRTPKKFTKNAHSLVNHLLIAMPSLNDPHFERSVIYLCAQDENGAMGIVINRALNISVRELLEHLNLPVMSPLSDPVLSGGPVHPDNGFVLHKPGTNWADTWQVSHQLCITTSPDILQAMAEDRGPEEALIALGYAGWSAGQLEQELLANAWLTVPASAAIVFDTPLQERWQAATRLLGIEVARLSGVAGHA